jgi:hypothetical protein
VFLPATFHVAYVCRHILVGIYALRGLFDLLAVLNQVLSGFIPCFQGSIRIIDEIRNCLSCKILTYLQLRISIPSDLSPEASYTLQDI